VSIKLINNIQPVEVYTVVCRVCQSNCKFNNLQSEQTDVITTCCLIKPVHMDQQTKSCMCK